MNALGNARNPAPADALEISGILLAESDLLEIDTDHHSEWDKGDDVRDHLVLVS